jgi:nitronate monooxygenase
MTVQTLLGIDLPVIQAPMAGVQGSALAVAVSNAGGLGGLPCALLSIDAMRSELASIKAQTARPFNLNFFCHVMPPPAPVTETAWQRLLAPYYAELGIDAAGVAPLRGRAPFDEQCLELLKQFKPAVVSFHFGLPPPGLLQATRSTGAKILSSATTVAEARWLEAQGVDAIIAQGNEAGGHRGIFLSDDLSTQVGTLALVPQIVRATNLPVIAAGGIADAQGVAAVMKLGAVAAQIGTAYLLCPESTTSAVHRAALQGERARHTTLTTLFTGRPARAIVNRLIENLGALNPAAPPFPYAARALAPLRARAEAQGSGDFSPMWSGQNASGCKEVGAAELTRELAGVSRPAPG